MTAKTIAVMNQLLDRPGEWAYGLELIRALGFQGGTVYPLLARLERAGWLESEREAVDPAEAGRPRRKLYRLTGEGQRRAALEIDRVRADFGVLTAPRTSARRAVRA